MSPSSLSTKLVSFIAKFIPSEIQVNMDMTDSMGPGKLVRHMQNPSYTYDEYLICIGLGPSISTVICKDPSYSGPSYPSSPVLTLPEILFCLIIYISFIDCKDLTKTRYVNYEHNTEIIFLLLYRVLGKIKEIEKQVFHPKSF